MGRGVRRRLVRRGERRRGRLQPRCPALQRALCGPTHSKTAGAPPPPCAAPPLRRQQPGKSQHGFDGLAGTEGEVPSFLYAMPLGGKRVFLEETCLVARPALPFNTLKRRLERRCKALGIQVSSRVNLLFGSGRCCPERSRLGYWQRPACVRCKALGIKASRLQGRRRGGAALAEACSGDAAVEDTRERPRQLLQAGATNRRFTWVARHAQVKEVHEEEWSYIPVGGPLPLPDQQAAAFGAAACLVHPGACTGEGPAGGGWVGGCTDSKPQAS